MYLCAPRSSVELSARMFNIWSKREHFHDILIQLQHSDRRACNMGHSHGLRAGTRVSSLRFVIPSTTLGEVAYSAHWTKPRIVCLFAAIQEEGHDRVVYVSPTVQVG